MIQDNTKEDFDWFIDHYSEIFNRYGKCYALISKGKLVDTYISYSDAVRNGEARFGLGGFIVQKCDGTKEAYTCAGNHAIC